MPTTCQVQKLPENRSKIDRSFFNGNLGVFLGVVVALDIHVIDEAHCEQVEILDLDSKLHTAKQEERGRHLPDDGMPFL